MANILPGAIYKPISHYQRPLRRKGRGACAHVAVSNSADLRPWNANDWHFYLPKSGPAIQYVDMDFVAACQGDGNPTLVSWESQGGVIDADNEPWTDNQVEWGARIMAHLHDTEGAPLQVMPNSLPTSRGLGYHRLGISPWRVAGGEVWSRSAGKICPGSAKIRQIPQIIARAKQIAAGGTQEDDMTPAQEQMLKDIRAEVMAGRRQDYVVLSGKVDRLAAALKAGGNIDEAALAAALAPSVIEAIGEAKGLTAADIEAAVARVLARAANG